MILGNTQFQRRSNLLATYPIPSPSFTLPSTPLKKKETILRIMVSNAKREKKREKKGGRKRNNAKPKWRERWCFLRGTRSKARGNPSLEIPRKFRVEARVYVRPCRVIPAAETSRIRIILLARTPKHLLRLNVPWNGMVVPADGNQHRRKFQRDLLVTCPPLSRLASRGPASVARIIHRDGFISAERIRMDPGNGTSRNPSLDSLPHSAEKRF